MAFIPLKDVSTANRLQFVDRILYREGAVSETRSLTPGMARESALTYWDVTPVRR